MPFAGKLAPCPHQSARLQTGADDGPRWSGWVEDPSLVLPSYPATQLRGGGPGGSDWLRERESCQHRGGLLLPPSVHWRLLWGEESDTPSTFTIYDFLLHSLYLSRGAQIATESRSSSLYVMITRGSSDEGPDRRKDEWAETGQSNEQVYTRKRAWRDNSHEAKTEQGHRKKDPHGRNWTVTEKITNQTNWWGTTYTN